MTEQSPRQPPSRRLRIYSLDPSLQTSLETAVINETTIAIPWEDLEQGPRGEYIEVIDHDPASDRFYRPVDLEQRHILAQDGLKPSEGNPRFHQQMVYAVAMRTIENFERALGRPVLWSDQHPADDQQPSFVRRLRIYPHALREANAYYSPSKKALLFGYFPADASDPGGHLPGGIVFSCLSHDIIAHEMSHALLDGIHRHFIEASNPDVLAFHEAFADLVALLQHFAMPEVVAHEFTKNRGELRVHSLLGALATQFGKATGRRGALRNAIGARDEYGRWHAHEPQPGEYRRTREPHARGAILVAAIFDAFIAVYERRSEDLIRIASGGTGILPNGRLHPDLINRLANEASKTARQFLMLCIRALDYCPPVDITFGEYLRAMITADRDLVPDDTYGYRVALIEACRRRGIYPRGVRTLSEESLTWRPLSAADEEALTFLQGFLDEVKRTFSDWDMEDNREKVRQHGVDKCDELQDMIEELREGGDPDTVERAYRTFGMSSTVDGGRFEVHSVRPARRTGPSGHNLLELVVELTQRRPIFLDETGEEVMPETWDPDREASARGWFRGGCTLIVDIAKRTIRYCIVKRIDAEGRSTRQRQFQRAALARSLRATYMGPPGPAAAEPFALLHGESEGEHDDE